MIAACDLLASVGATIVECACMVELKMLGGYAKLQEKHPSVKVICNYCNDQNPNFAMSA